jgi:CPA2 family monovalent cation:H+ antiporter-2
MGHLPTLITDLALILITAAVVSLLFKKLKQPLVLGYILAGFLVSPYSHLIPTIADIENVKVLADIGVIFLLFSLGLEFSFKKLVRVGASASVTAIFEIVCIMVLGFFTGKLLGWTTMDCLFLGGMLASSSTTIIIRAFDELGLKSKHYVKTVFGVLVVEDIVVILLMVLLSTIAVTQRVEGVEMMLTVLKLAFFLILWFLMGIFIIPTLLKKVKNLLNDEGYLILSIGLCLGMVILATQAGFSAELGAFIMGSILAETTSAEKVEHVFEPVKNLFGAIFFVSIGMMINPVVIVEYGWVVLLITLLIIFGKFFSTTIGALISGQPLKQAVEVGMSMAQIGEFAFIVATLGMSLGVISDFLFPIAVGASAITTFTTPYMIKYSDKVYNFIEKIMPDKWLHLINLYTARADKPKSETETRKLIKKIVSIVLLNVIIALAIVLLFSLFVLPLLNKHMSGILPQIIVGLLGLLLLLPFLWASIFKMPNNLSSDEIINNKNYNRNKLSFVVIVRFIFGMLIVGFFAYFCFNSKIAILAIVPLFFIVLLVFADKIKQFYRKIERRFMLNLHGREIAAAEQAAPMSNIGGRMNNQNANIKNWEAHLTDMSVPQNAHYIGRTLDELDWRERFGINVVYIKRGENIIYSPDADCKLMPLDLVGVFASDEAIEQFESEFYAEQKVQTSDLHIEDIVVEKIHLETGNPLINKKIKNSAIKEDSGGMVVAIERGGEKIISPSASFTLKEDDRIWVVGERKKVGKLKKF